MKARNIFAVIGGLVLATTASANIVTVKYSCDNNIELSVSYQSGGNFSFAQTLEINGSAIDGNYTGMGDGFGFAKTGANDQMPWIFLDSNLYRGKAGGVLELPNDVKVNCRAE